MPTIAAVLLGFVWRSLVSDLKLLTPWSAVTRRTEPASDFIAVDYVNIVEILAIWPAIRRGYWPLCIGLVGALLAAVLVSFMNALTIGDPASRIVEDNLTFRQTSLFEFENSLTHEDGTLTIAWKCTGSQPYAALTSAQQDNGKFPAWTTDGSAFTSFEPVVKTDHNATLKVNATAFSTRLNCTRIGTSLREATATL